MFYKRSSFVYKSIKKYKNIFQNNISHSIKNEKDFNLWNDWWLNNNTLRNQLIGPLPRSESTKKVSSIIVKIDNINTWNLNSLLFPISSNLSDQIQNIPLPYPGLNLVDNIFWTFTTHNEVILNYAYNSRLQTYNQNPSPLLDQIWKTKCEQQEKFFLQKTYNKGLAVMSSLYHRNINPSSICPLCNTNAENHDHALRSCTKISPVWMSLATPQTFLLITSTTGFSPIPLWTCIISSTFLGTSAQSGLPETTAS